MRTCDSGDTGFRLQVPKFEISILRPADQDDRVSGGNDSRHRFFNMSDEKSSVPSWAWSKLWTNFFSVMSQILIEPSVAEVMKVWFPGRMTIHETGSNYEMRMMSNTRVNILDGLSTSSGLHVPELQGFMPGYEERVVFCDCKCTYLAFFSN